MRNALAIILVGVLVVVCVSAPAAAQVRKIDANLVEVTVIGAGMTEEEALSDAKRKAIEQGAGAFIYSQSKTRDFALVKDTILTRSAGFVQKVTVLSKKETDDGAWELKVRAVVSVKGIEDMWGVVTNLLQEMGQPKIMVAINERIDGQLQEDSSLQTAVENMLLKSGFRLVDKGQIKAIDVKDIQAGIAENKPALVQAIAKRYGAQLFIVGSANATSGGRRNIYGINVFLYGADANVRCFRSDTAELLASKRSTAQSNDRVARPAASKALAVLGRKLGPRIRQDILRFWMDVLAGRGEVQLEMENISFGQFSKLKKALKKLKEVKSVAGNFHNKVGKLRMHSNVSASKLAEVLAESLEGVIEITDVSQNVIKGTYIGK